MQKKSGLGTGLSSLLGPDYSSESGDRDVLEINIDRVQSCSFQPRRFFKVTELEELAESIKENGILQPIVVRKSGEFFEIIAGERRWRAAKLAGLRSVPVIQREASDREVLKYAIIENIQRENLTAMEEAESYEKLRQDYGYNHEELAQILGKSRSHVSNMLRLCSLDPHVKEIVELHNLSAGHARALLAFDSVLDQIEMIDRIRKENLSVREVEKASQITKKPKKQDIDFSPKERKKDSYYQSPDQVDISAIQEHLAYVLRAKVSIYNSGSEVVLKIECPNYEVLDVCVEKLSVS